MAPRPPGVVLRGPPASLAAVNVKVDGGNVVADR
jgi:hypothetical protein